MSTFDWVLIGWWVLGTLLMISNIGKPRKPIEPSTAVVAVIINGGLAVGLLITRGVL